MLILIPMGGKGSRFSQAGYTTPKAMLPTTNRHTGNTDPMIICAMKDMPGIEDAKNQIVCVNRPEHLTLGLESTIQHHFPHTVFIHDHVQLDQAFGCFLAREHLMQNTPLFIGACDSGMIYDEKAFLKKCMQHDAIMLSHTNNPNIAHNPNAHSWAKLKANGVELEALSLKKTVSTTPMLDHATTGMFWFKSASVFLNHLEKMIWQQDTLDGKYYVDNVLQYFINDGLSVGYFDVKLLCWGTPQDHQHYEGTMAYWKQFLKEESAL